MLIHKTLILKWSFIICINVHHFVPVYIRILMCSPEDRTALLSGVIIWCQCLLLHTQLGGMSEASWGERTANSRKLLCRALLCVIQCLRVRMIANLKFNVQLMCVFIQV